MNSQFWRWLRRSEGGDIPLGLATIMLILFIGLPIFALFWKIWRDFAARQIDVAILNNLMVREALLLSLKTTLATLFLSILIGTPAAYVLAHFRFRGRLIVDTLVDLPIVLPPAVGGLALLMTFGRQGLLGAWLSQHGLTFAFTPQGVVLAQFFVAAPFYVRTARSGFASLRPELAEVASTFGAGRFYIFTRISIPMALPSLIGGAVLCWARALGEFGATIMFAGNFPGHTQTMPLGIYEALETDLDAALILSAILVVISAVILLAIKTILHKHTADL